MQTLRKVLAFVKRDFLQTASYRMNFAFSVLGIMFQCLTFFFFSRLLVGQNVATLQPYGGEYFPFVLIGLAFWSFLSVGLGALSDSISRSQTTGTLESLLVTPTAATIIIFSSTLFPFLFAAARVGAYLILGTLFFGVALGNANLPAALFILALSTACFTAMGMLSAAWVMVFKKGDPAGWIFGGVNTLLGGVLFPVKSLPAWLQPASALLPNTHALEAIRLAVLRGAGLADLWKPIGALAVFAAILLPIGVLAFSIAVRRAKRTGSLVQY